jgi:two-component system NtrC family sensor kinase
VEVDEYQLEQVILHLVNNAHRAMQSATAADLREPARNGGTITVTTEATDDTVRVIVDDEGPGVPQELATRIFEPFYTTSEEVSGRGMGLSIVYGIVTERGGRVWVEPREPRGARFVVELPAGNRERSSGARAADAPAAAGRILVVDDELSIRALTREILSARGYTVEVARGGEEALRMIEDAPYDLVVSDVRMPGVDGAEFYARAGELRPELQERFIFITGDIDNERIAALRRRPGVGLIEKPFGAAGLLRAVREALGEPG